MSKVRLESPPHGAPVEAAPAGTVSDSAAASDSAVSAVAPDSAAASDSAIEPVLDVFGRAPLDLRISVTDRCNFRCGYCMPRDKVDGSSFLPRSEVLDFEEIVRAARLFRNLGTTKLRVTGGEPLLRRDLPRLVEQLSELDCEIALTTNGVLLPKLAPALHAAGLHRITISLDALEPKAFQEACDAPQYGPKDVLAGIEAAQRAGFSGLKVNCVVRRGYNEHQILPLARHFAHQDITVRFIEYMDVGTRNNWELPGVVSKAEILELLSQDGPLQRMPPRSRGEVAARFAGPHGEVGIIASVTEPFCGDCCRARLSADGSIYTCLFAHQGMSLKEMMREGASDTELAAAIRSLWGARQDRYSELRRLTPGPSAAGDDSGKTTVHLPTIGRVEMSYIGG